MTEPQPLSKGKKELGGVGTWCIICGKPSVCCAVVNTCTSVRKKESPPIYYYCMKHRPRIIWRKVLE